MAEAAAASQQAVAASQEASARETEVLEQAEAQARTVREHADMRVGAYLPRSFPTYLPPGVRVWAL